MTAKELAELIGKAVGLAVVIDAEPDTVINAECSKLDNEGNSYTVGYLWISGEPISAPDASDMPKGVTYYRPEQ